MGEKLGDNELPHDVVEGVRARRLRILLVRIESEGSEFSFEEDSWRNANLHVSKGERASLPRLLDESVFDAVALLAHPDELPTVVREIREARRFLPVVVLGKTESAHDAVVAMRAGASDYLITNGLTASEARTTFEEVILESQASRQREAVDEARKAADKVLRERELQIRGFFDFASVAMALVSPQGDVIRANPALRKLCGYGLQELTQLKLSRLILPEDRATVSEGLSMLLTHQVDVCDDEVRFRHKSGAGIWVSVSFAVITDEDGEVQGYTLHATDIRTRKATEAELQRSERRFQELLAQAPIGIFETSIAGSCRYVNDKWTEVAGLNYSDAIGPGWTRTIHPDDSRRILGDWRAAVKEERAFAAEFRFQRPDGEVIWVTGRAEPTRDHEGTVMGYLGTVSDVSDRHRAEDDLRRTGALLRGVLDSAPYSVIVTSIDGAVLEINRGAVDLLGYEANEVLGRLAWELVHDGSELEGRLRGLSAELEQEVAPGMPALAELTRGAKESEWIYVRKDGTRFPVELTVSEMRDLEGRLYGYVAIANDVTERVRRSKELLSAKEEAERATAAKADFLARMSHEIRTPMNSVLGMTEIALQTQLTVEQQSYLQLVQDSGKSLLRLINDILDFSKGEAKGLQLDHVPFHLYETFALCLRGLSHKAKQNGVELVLRVAADAPKRVVGDPHRIQQILVNLVGNAVKFTEQGEVVVDVECATGGPGGRVTLYLQVNDTGPGVARDEQERIFRAFTQEDSGIAGRFGGTGLGLAICSQLVELMDGEIWLDSELGKGSRFHVTLGLEGDVEPSSPEAPLPEKNLCRQDQLILVVERNEKSREVTRTLLERAGYKLVSVANAAGAIEHANSLQREGGRFAVAILDLPHWDGRGRRLVDKLEKINGPLGIICLSPTGQGEDHRWTGQHVNLVKPVLPEELERSLIEALLPSSERRVQSLAAPIVQAPASRALNILVAEDNPTNQHVVFTMLERLGHKTSVVANGQEALDRLESESFDLVLMDMQMPVMGGLEAVRTLRQRERGTGAHVPVVALTAQAMQGDRERCLSEGMDDYLSKPLDMEALGQVLVAQSMTDPLSLREAFLPKPSSQEARMVDLPGLLRRIGDSPVALAKITELFERDTAKLLGELEDQVATAGPSLKSGAAHTLKGMLRNMCCQQAAEMATELEMSTVVPDWKLARTLLDNLKEAVNRAALDLRTEVERSSPN